MRSLGLYVLAALSTSAVARDVPDNLRALYDSIRGRGSCKNKLASGFYASARGLNGTSCLGRQVPKLLNSTLTRG